MIDLLKSARRFLGATTRSQRNRRNRTIGTGVATHELLEQRLLLTAQIDFDFTVIASDLSPTERFFGSMDSDDAPYTILRYGFGQVTNLTGFNDLDDLGTITFEFGSDNSASPVEALSLTSFDGGSAFPTVQNAMQVYTADAGDDASLKVYEDGVQVASGTVSTVSLETTPQQVVTSPASAPSSFVITAAVGDDTTVYDELMAATGGTGIVSFSLSAFNLQGTWAGVGDAAIFTSTGQSIGLMTTVAPDDHGDDNANATPWDRTGQIDGAHQTNDDVDVFSVQLEANTQYTFDVVDNDQQGEDYVFPYVVNGTDTTIAEGDPIPGTNTMSVSVTPDITGTYFLHTRSTMQRGSYSITQRSTVDVSTDDHGDAFDDVNEVFDATDSTPWDRQAPIAGNIGNHGEYDAFRVDLTAGTEYVFRTNPGTLYDTILEVLDGTTGVIVGSNDDADDAGPDEYHSKLAFVPDTTGSYLLLVSGFGVDDPGSIYYEPYRVGSYTLEMLSQTVLPPAVPEINPIASPVDTGQPTISWNPVNGADDYVLYISPWNDSAAAVVNMTLTETSYTLSNALPNGSWRAWVRARSSQGGYSGWSAPVQFRVASAPTLTPDSFVTDSDTPTLTWDAVPGAQTYNVYINNLTTGATGVVNMTGISGTSYTAGSSLDFGTQRVWVQAVDEDGLGSGWSPPVEIWNGADPISGTGASLNMRPTFSWEPIPGATSYHFYMFNGGVTTSETGLSTNSYTPSADLSYGAARWWVQATGPGGTTWWGDPQDLNIGGGPTLTMTSATVVSWDAVDGADRYGIWIDRVSPPSYGIVNRDDLTTTTYDLAGLQRSRPYRVWVRAIMEGGTTGAWSNAVDMYWTLADL